MNKNKHVVIFTLFATCLLFIYSMYAAVSGTDHLSLNNISILADVLAPGKDKDITVQPKSDTLHSTLTATLPTGPRMLQQYLLPRTITNFSTDTTLPALPVFMGKLAALKQGRKQKLRIAWLGDSMIEGDLVSQTVRRLLQQYTGSYGVGFVPATSVTAAFRTTVSHKWQGGWKEENFRTDKPANPLYLSGHAFYTADGIITLKDNTVHDTLQRLDKSLLCGYSAGVVTLQVNGRAQQYRAGKKINRLPLDSSMAHTISVTVQDDKLPVYGISMEPQSGVVVDNLSFRGITGIELNKLDTAFLKEVQTESPYDLVILEYGANLMFRPDDTDYTWFQKHIIPVIKKVKSAMPNAEFLIICTADRAFRYGDTWRTATGIYNVVKMQAQLAYDNNAAFYNMYQSMGGAGTVVRWADSSTALANKDYIHPNQRGAEVLGNMLYGDIMKDLAKVHTAPDTLKKQPAKPANTTH